MYYIKRNDGTLMTERMSKSTARAMVDFFATLPEFTGELFKLHYDRAGNLHRVTLNHIDHGTVTEAS